jgi:hypothetical protein
MPSYAETGPRPDFSLLARTFGYRPGARFTGLLEPSFFEELAAKHDVEFGQGQHDTFSPAVTTWAWLSQVLSSSKSCTAAAARVLVLCCSLSLPVCSIKSGAYCKARAKVPVAFFQDATRQLGRLVEQRALPDWRWKNLCVKIADGSIVQVPDTDANRAVYPQQSSQTPGTSPTCLRLVVVLALATAVLVDARSGAYRGKGTGEMSLLYAMLEQFGPGDVLLGDRYYGCYLLLAGLPLRGAQGCFRLPVQKEKSFATGQQLGPDDWLQTWHKPRRPEWIDPQEWDKLPFQVQVRVLRLRFGRKGWRTKEVYLVTTLTDPVAYPAADLAALYLARWNAELDIRSIKQTLGMKMLSCKTPQMVEAELWAHLFGYNLLRCVMAQAALEAGLCPRQLSLAGAMQTLDAFRWLLGCSDKDQATVCAALNMALATHRVGNRPGRYEPREVKHRQRKYKELKKSRRQRRAELADPKEEQGQAQGQGKGKRKGRGKDRPSGR